MSETTVRRARCAVLVAAALLGASVVGAAAVVFASLVWFATLVTYLRVTRPTAAVVRAPAPPAPP